MLGYTMNLFLSTVAQEILSVDGEQLWLIRWTRSGLWG